MGAVFFSIDPKLVETLRTALPLTCFVETGTFRGDTVDLVREDFPTVYSVELAAEIHEVARKRFQHAENVQLVHGDSASELKWIVTRVLDQSTLFFLDAHWCDASQDAAPSAGCPLLEELAAIGDLSATSVVVIDDARLFFAPPGSTTEDDDWPDLIDVLHGLRALSNEHKLMVVNDCIVFFPACATKAMESYARAHGIDWLKLTGELRSVRTQIDILKKICDERNEALRLKESKIEELHTLLIDSARRYEQIGNGAGVSRMHSELIEKEVVIQTLAKSLRRRQRLEWIGDVPSGLARHVRNLARLATPKLGRLRHHPPIALRLQPVHVPGPEIKNNLPSICVVTPSWQQANFIERTILSVLDQDYQGLEYVVQDGGSDDGTANVLQRYRTRFSAMESAPDHGQSHALNKGFAKTSAEIMCWLNSDDILLPGTLFYVGEYFSNHPEVDVVYGHRILIDEHDMEIGRWVLPRHHDSVLKWVDFIPQETLFWRRRVWDRAGGHVNQDFEFALDWELLLRFREVGARMVRLPRFLGAFRVHPSQKTSMNIEGTGYREMVRLREHATGLQNISDRQIQRAIAPFLFNHVVHDISWRIKDRFNSMGRTIGNRDRRITHPNGRT